MFRAFKYRLHPTQTQEKSLYEWLDLTRNLYNDALQERHDAWQKQHCQVSRFDQEKQLTDIRAAETSLALVPLVVLRGALRRLDTAFQGFFRRCKTGEKPGYPRFKGHDRWKTITIEDLKKSPIVAGGSRVSIPMLGKVKIGRLNNRPPRGVPKVVRITRNFTGRWTLVLICADVPAKPLPKVDRQVGVDLGLIHFAATSDGDIYKNVRPLAEAKIQIKRAQRRLSRRKKNGKYRHREAKRLLAKHHTRVKNIRREQHIQIARDLVVKYDTIVVEKLNIKGLAGGILAKLVNDAAWGNFLHWLHCKAEEAGRVVLEVNPRGTSQTCSGCGVVVKKSLAVRTHKCSDCGLVLDRDINAARNILGLGYGLQGVATSVKVRRRSAKTLTDSG